MRRRIILATTGVTIGVLLLAGLPLVVLVQRLARAEAAMVLRRQAEAIATELADDIAARRPVTRPRLNSLVPPGDQLVLLTPDGSVVVAGSPVGDDAIAVDVEAIGGARLRLLTSADPVEARTEATLLRLAVLGLVAVALSATLAAILAGRLTGPLDAVAASAARLGRGDFSTTSPKSGLEEIDTIAAALDTSARRIAALVRSEREFSANASHQLRSALTGLRLRLEGLAASADPGVAAEAEAALAQADRLAATVDDLLRLARTGRYADAGTVDLADLARRHVADQEPRLVGAGRTARVHAAGSVTVHAAAGAIGQALDVLVDNAIRHGRGTIDVHVAASPTHASVTVADEGRLGPDGHELFGEAFPRGDHGIGLRLARTLVEADGGRLDLISTEPTTFRVTLPRPAPDLQPPG